MNICEIAKHFSKILDKQSPRLKEPVFKGDYEMLFHIF